MPINHVIMLASENDALKNAKVGGVGDVVRDLPRALAKLGWHTTVIVPSYGFLHQNNPSELKHGVRFPFGGKDHEGEIWEAQSRQPDPNITQLLFHHDDIGGEPIYFNDPPEHAFAKDATKYAMFCSGVGQYLKQLKGEFVVHLHDWHTGFYFLLRELHPAFAHLKSYKSVFSIHNLAIQGTRPMHGRYASVEQWFPELFQDKDWVLVWRDPHHKDDTFTPMAAGIRFADKVNTVSPTYAEEILLPSNRRNGQIRGEKLEAFLQEAKKEGRLLGILNGAEYPEDRKAPKMDFKLLCDLVTSEVTKWNEKKHLKLNDEILERVKKLRTQSPSILLTSVTRVTDQKVLIFFEQGRKHGVGLDEILTLLQQRGGMYFFLGNGSPEFEEKLVKAYHKHECFVYLRGYSDPIAQALYANGNLFMMPSSFEPCGIGQMIAMRDRQPCVVHAVGGLKDTVIDGVNGFTFNGKTLHEQVDGLVNATERALRTYFDDKPQWNKIVENAGGARFTWEESAKKYIEMMYRK